MPARVARRLGKSWLAGDPVAEVAHAHAEQCGGSVGVKPSLVERDRSRNDGGLQFVQLGDQFIAHCALSSRLAISSNTSAWHGLPGVHQQARSLPRSRATYSLTCL